MATPLKHHNTEQPTSFLAAKDNPFAVQLTSAIPFQFRSGKWQDQIRRLKVLNYRAAIVGPRGTGKSTCLKTLRARLDKAGLKNHYLFLPHENDSHPSLIDEACKQGASGAILLVDGIERLRWTLKWLILRSKQIVATTHRRQYIPPFYLPTWFATTTCKKLLSHILSELGIQDTKIRHRADALFDLHRGNIREVLRELYDLKAANTI